MVSRTGKRKNGYGKVYHNVYRLPYWNNLNTGTCSNTGRNEKLVREDIDSEYVPVLEEIKNGYRKVLIANMVSRTGKNEKRVMEDIESEYSFSYWKK